MSKKVSIAIMCYNQEDFISETIESALQQTYSNIEICISDDCSTDRTYEIILQYKEKHPEKIKCFQQAKNQGKKSLCINANSMLKLCSGEYIALLDGDDIMYPKRIEQQIAFLEKNSTYIGVSGWVESFDHSTGKILGNIHKHVKATNHRTQSLIEFGNSIPPCFTFRKNPHITYNTSLKIMGDWLFYIELSMLGNIGHIGEYLGRYRIHKNNSMNKNLSYDNLRTLDIIESKYPNQFQKNIKKCRISALLVQSLQFYKAGENKQSLVNITSAFQLDFLYASKQVITKIFTK